MRTNLVGKRPDTVDLRDHARELLWAATRGPSYGNAQPWSFRVARAQVEIFADLSRSHPIADPQDRQLFLGLGAAVYGVRLAMARLGLRPVIGLSRDHARPDLAAVVLAAGPGRGAEEDQLYDELGRRRTARTAFADERIPLPVQIQISERIRCEGATPHWLIRSGTRRTVTELIQRIGPAGLSDPRPEELKADGPATPGLPQPAPLVICTPNDHRADRLRAGQALHRGLLTASAAGLSATFLSQLLEIPLLRAQLRTDLRLPGSPQVLLGLGRPLGPPTPPTPRRPLASVLRA